MASRRQESLPRPLPSSEGGFTLMEIVLAIGLTSVVMYLLMTAIELYMVRVDSSRTRVESAQLARTILDQMAADIAATRLFAPSAQASMGGASGGPQGAGSSSGSGFGSTNSGASGFPGANDGGAEGSRVSGSSGTPQAGGVGGTQTAQVQGIFGAINQLRIDRSAYPNWQRAARQVLPEEPSTVADLPASVRYYFNEGDPQTSQEFALEGVPEEAEPGDRRTGLYREVYTTAALAEETEPLNTTVRREGARVELLAPEVVKMELSYFDGSQYIDEWDSFEEGALPAGIEIRLTIYEPSFDPESNDRAQSSTGQPSYRANELVEYRRFVRLPSITPAQPSESLLPVGGGGEQQQIAPGGGGRNGQGQGGQGSAGRGGGNNVGNGGGDG